MLYVKEASGPVGEVADRVAKVTAENGFGVMATHDLKAKMAEKGVAFQNDCRILEVCNPRQAKRVLEGDPTISTALPCRISIYEQEGQVKVATLRPTALLEMFGSDELQNIAREVEETMLRIIDQACQEV